MKKSANARISQIWQYLGPFDVQKSGVNLPHFFGQLMSKKMGVNQGNPGNCQDFHKNVLLSNVLPRYMTFIGLHGRK